MTTNQKISKIKEMLKHAKQEKTKCFFFKDDSEYLAAYKKWSEVIEECTNALEGLAEQLKREKE